MAYCSACGAEVDDNADFCSECGNQIGEDISKPEADTKKEASEYDHPGEDGIAWKHAIVSVLMAIIPAVILSIILPVQALKAIGLLGGIVILGYLGYQRPTLKSSFGRISFWTAIFLFLSPLGMILNTFVFASQETQGTAEQAGAAIGGTILIIIAFVIGIPLGIAFYLLHRRYDIDTDAQGG